jgi:hypothetical protein
MTHPYPPSGGFAASMDSCGVIKGVGWSIGDVAFSDIIEPDDGLFSMMMRYGKG